MEYETKQYLKDIGWNNDLIKLSESVAQIVDSGSIKTSILSNLELEKDLISHNIMIATGYTSVSTSLEIS